MTVIERLKLELAKQPYFEDAEYTQFLLENNLTSTDTYNKETMQKALLYTVLDILEAVSNDVDIMRRVTTEFTDTTTAYKSLADRIAQVKDRIATIPNPEDEEEVSCFSLMYTKNS